MSVKIVKKDAKFRSELVNGSDFSLFPTKYTETLADSPTGKCRAEFIIEVSSGFSISNYQLLYAGSVDADNDVPFYKIYKADGNFLDQDIPIGSTIYFSFPYENGNNAQVDSFIMEVTDVSNDTLYFTVEDIGGALNAMYTRVNNEDVVSYTESAYIAVAPSFTGLAYSYNLIENNQGNVSFVSDLTGTTNVTKVRNVQLALGSSVKVGTPTTNNKAWVMGDVTVELIDKVYNYNVLDQQKLANQYRITHDFIVPYYYDGEEENLENIITPPDLYNGTSSPKYIFETTWYTDINKPETGATIRYSDSIGASGYFGEAFNGDFNPYEVSNLTYTDITDGGTTDRLSIGKRTRVNFDIDNSLNDFVVDQSAVVAVGAIIDNSEYSSSRDNFKTVWTFETARNTAQSSDMSNDFIQDLSVIYYDSGNISVQFFVEYSTTQNSRLEEGQKYIIAVQVRNDSEDIVLNSHKVHLLVDYNVYGKNNDIEGLYGVDRFEQIPHPLDYTEDTTGYTNAQVNVEEGLLSYAEFWLDTSKYAILDDLSFNTGIINTVTDDIKYLTETQIDLSSGVLVGDSWNFNLDSTVGFPLANGDQFNYKKLITGENIGNRQYYKLLVGYRISWQDWKAWTDAPTSFYDATKELNGLNYNASNYSDIDNYQFRVFLNANVSQNGVSTNYINSSEDIDVYNYDEDETGLPTYTCDIATFSEDGTELENNMIVDGYTKIVATVTPDSVPTFSQDIDFSNVSTIYNATTNPNGWKRFAFGNQYNSDRIGDDPLEPSLNAWIDQTADDNDQFNSSGGGYFNKLDNLYTSTSTQIIANENCNAFYGCASVDKYEVYQASGKMYADPIGNNDNDSLLFQIAHTVDEFGKEHTLSLVATTGGMDVFINTGQAHYSAYVEGDPNSRIFTFFLPADSLGARVALVYNYGKSDWAVLDHADSSEPQTTWYDAGDLNFNVVRVGSSITASFDWDINGSGFNDTMTYNLNENAYTQKFQGAQSIGFGFMSQSNGGFKDVSIAIPSADYWSALRIEPENSNSEKSMYELSNDIEGDTDNLLKQNSGDSIVSSQDYDGTSFILSSLVRTENILSGQEYKLSAQIGSNNLGSLDLLGISAWVDSSNPDKLNVMFNSYIDFALTDITGLSLVGTSANISGIDTVNSIDNFIVFDLDSNVLTGDDTGLIYSSSNTITALNSGLTLSANYLTVQNDI